jgi:hypothetical protein
MGRQDLGTAFAALGLILQAFRGDAVHRTAMGADEFHD